MIRKNFNLSDDLRRQEKKKQSSIQQRQKRQVQLERCKNTDPIRLYRRIQRIKEDDKGDKKLLERLEDDWSFIVKNSIHNEKVQPFLERIEQQHKRIEEQKSKLWGMKSVYFNPELNPLGKVPKNTGKKNLPNLTVPLKPSQKPPKDPRVQQMSISLPAGEPPKYYKFVQNTGEEHRTAIESSGSTAKMFVPTQMLKRPRDSQLSPEEEQYKRQQVSDSI